MDALSKLQTCATSRYSKKRKPQQQPISISFIHVTTPDLYLSSHLSAIHRSRLKTPSKDAKMKNKPCSFWSSKCYFYSGKEKKKANRNWSSKGELGIWGYPHDSVMPGLLYAVENKGADR